MMKDVEREKQNWVGLWKSGRMCELWMVVNEAMEEVDDGDHKRAMNGVGERVTCEGVSR